MKTICYFIKKACYVCLLITGTFCFGQTPEQMEMIKKAQKMQDSILNSPFFKNLEAQVKKEEEAHQNVEKKKVEMIKDATPPRTDYPMNVENFPFNDMQLVTYPLGMKTPIAVGRIMEGGALHFELPVALQIPAAQVGSIAVDLETLFFSNCSDYTFYSSEKHPIMGFTAGQISFETKEGRYAGVLFAVSTEDLIPWLENPKSINPVVGSYYELVYVSDPLHIEKDCTQLLDTGNGEIPVLYQYDLQLQKGYQFIQYSLKSSDKATSKGSASIPDRIEVTTEKELPKALWMGKYF